MKADKGGKAGGRGNTSSSGIPSPDLLRWNCVGPWFEPRSRSQRFLLGNQRLGRRSRRFSHGRLVGIHRYQRLAFVCVGELVLTNGRNQWAAVAGLHRCCSRRRERPSRPRYLQHLGLRDQRSATGRHTSLPELSRGGQRQSSLQPRAVRGGASGAADFLGQLLEWPGALERRPDQRHSRGRVNSFNMEYQTAISARRCAVDPRSH